MSYSYELKLEQITQTIKQKKFIVHEFEDKISIVCHSVDFIVSQKSESNFSGTYLERMYKWLETVHPELIL